MAVRPAEPGFFGAAGLEAAVFEVAVFFAAVGRVGVVFEVAFEEAGFPASVPAADGFRAAGFFGADFPAAAFFAAAFQGLAQPMQSRSS
ncbi:hypothetical protein ABZ702_19265 [Streptomyces cyaneofuscatus]|uniref:hypothetical protein n=1 Tax=Streptomyces cyaneofuscatus TaxID=66883 RepID=UPI0033EE53A6